MAFTFAGRYGPEIFEDENRHLLKSKPVTVYNGGTNVLANLYADRTKLVAGPNPFITDARGNGYFFADPGEYDLDYAGWRISVTVDMDPIEAQGDGPPTGPAGGDLAGSNYPNPVIKADAITTAKILDLAVTISKLAANSVNASKIVDGSITSAEIDASIATTAALNTAINNLRTEILDAPPGLLDTLNELAAAIGDDPNFAATVTALIAAKLDKNLYDANTVLVANVDNTPLALTMGLNTVLMRAAAGNIIAGTPAQLRTFLGLPAADSYTADIGAGTGTVAIVHNLNTTDIRSILVKKVSTGAVWGVGAVVTDANTVTLDFDTYVRTAAEFRVEIGA